MIEPKLCTRQTLKLRLTLNSRNNNRRHVGDIAEQFSVALVPKLPKASMMREAKYFLLNPLGDMKLNHHSFTVAWLAQVDTFTTDASPSQ
jgi:hypothetical protein